MSIILNETKVYPGWELPKNEMAKERSNEEKALLINIKQNYIFLFAKTGAALGLLLGAYSVLSKYNIIDKYFSISEMVTTIALYVLAAGLAGYLTGIIFAKIYGR
jgi:hypothetical protein